MAHSDAHSDARSDADFDAHSDADPAPNRTEPWELRSSSGPEILGLTTRTDPEAGPGGASGSVAGGRLAGAVFVVAHGFKGFMGYGMFPSVADRLAREGAVVHRFNFAHSGMTRDESTFARPDLFARDTWNRQVDDLATVTAAIRGDELAGADRDLFLLGHSRGGVAVLLAAGRDVVGGPAGLISIAAPADCRRASPEAMDRFRREGFTEVLSSRTGQSLRIDAAWLTEQEEDPAAHDLLAVAGRITRPALLLHGTADETVPVGDVVALSSEIGGPVRTRTIEGANHVLDCVHPMDPAGPRPGAFDVAMDAIVDFAAGD